MSFTRIEGPARIPARDFNAVRSCVNLIALSISSRRPRRADHRRPSKYTVYLLYRTFDHNILFLFGDWLIQISGFTFGPPFRQIDLSEMLRDVARAQLRDPSVMVGNRA